MAEALLGPSSEPSEETPWIVAARPTVPHTITPCCGGDACRRSLPARLNRRGQEGRGRNRGCRVAAAVDLGRRPYAWRQKGISSKAPPSGGLAAHTAGHAISGRFVGLAHAGYSQAAAVYSYAEALCRAVGTAMDRLLRAQYFVTDIVAFPGIAAAWSNGYGGRPYPFLCTQTPTPLPAPG